MRGFICLFYGCFICPYEPRYIKDNTKLMLDEKWTKLRSKGLILNFTYS